MGLRQLLHQAGDFDRQRKRIRARICRIANPMVAKGITEFNKSAACCYVIERYRVVLQPFNGSRYIEIEIRDVSTRPQSRHKSAAKSRLEAIEHELSQVMKSIYGMDDRVFRVSVSSELFGK